MRSSPVGLERFLADHGITQAEMARAIGTSRAYISRLLSGVAGARKDTIDRILAFCRRYDPAVTYEDLFGPGGEVA